MHYWAYTETSVFVRWVTVITAGGEKVVSNKRAWQLNYQRS